MTGREAQAQDDCIFCLVTLRRASAEGSRQGWQLGCMGRRSRDDGILRPLRGLRMTEGGVSTPVLFWTQSPVEIGHLS
jgi:hypothetical protein